MGQLKKQYSAQLVRLGEMFSDWSTENLLTTLQENNGDLQATATKISEGPYISFKASACLPFPPPLQSARCFVTVKLKLYARVFRFDYSVG